MDVEVSEYFEGMGIYTLNDFLRLGKSNVRKFIDYYTNKYNKNDSDVKLLEQLRKKELESLEDKPLFPFHRSLKYLENDKEVLYYTKNNEIRGKKIEVLVQDYKFVYKIISQNGELLISPNDPALLSPKDEKYLKEHKEYARLWLSSIERDIPEYMRKNLLNTNEYEGE